jgi:hypothetical protein
MLHREPTTKSGDYSLGKVHEFVGAFGRSGGTPDLLQLAHENNLVMNRLVSCWRSGGTEYRFSEQEQRAYDLFGQEHFIHPGLTRLAWGELGSIDPEIRYSEETLLRCAQENKEGDLTTSFEYGWKRRPAERNWHLVYIGGFSLEYVLNKYSKWAPFVRDFGSEPFSKARMPAGYYLINYHALCGSDGEKNRKVQDDFLVALGKQYERIPASMVCEAAVTLCCAYGGRKALLYPAHWGNEKCRNGRYLSVEVKEEYTGSSFSTNIKIRLNAEHQGSGKYGGGAGVCIYRKYDF